MAEKKSSLETLNMTVVALVALVAIVGVVAIVLNGAKGAVQPSSAAADENVVGSAKKVPLHKDFADAFDATGNSCRCVGSRCAGNSNKEACQTANEVGLSCEWKCS